MRIHFSQDELKSISIRHSERPKPPEDYFKERDTYWEQQTLKAQQTNRKLWNGEVYTLEKIHFAHPLTPTLHLSTCEYKDILYTRDHGLERICDLVDPILVPRFITVCCIPITLDRRFVFGIRSRSTMVQEGSIGLIGGTVNRDEMLVNSLDDFTQFMIQEIQEETAIPSSMSTHKNLELFSLNFYRNKYEFLYRLPLPITSDQISSMHKDGEFSHLRALNATEARTVAERQLDAFQNCLSYLSFLDCLEAG